MADRTDGTSATPLRGGAGRGTQRADREAPKGGAEAPPVDVDALLASVRERLDRESGGASTPASPSVPPSKSAPEDALPSEPLARSLEVLKRVGPLDPHASIASHRALVGPFLVIGKRFLRMLLAPAFSAVFQHQQAIDRAILAYADEVFRRLVGMESDLRARLERVEARQAMELETVRRRLVVLEERAGIASPAGEPADRR